MNNQEQLNRMKAMMTYGLQTESKKNNFSSLEYNRLGADGKMYGIVREGTKYYIKVSENTKNLIKENFEYIGGFRNRKSNEYTSYANALKHFDLNMRSLNEAHGKGKKLIAESWNPETQEFIMVEATQKMYDEIQRQRQIMANASMIFEGKDGSCDCGNCNTKKEGAKKGQYDLGTGSAEDANGTGFSEDAPKKPEDMPNLYDQSKTNIKENNKGRKLHEADHGTLAWHKTGGGASETIGDTYLDTSKGTKIGNGAPFDGCPKGDSKREMKNGTVEEDTNLEECGDKSMAMDCGDNQNCPTPGVGDKMSKDRGPFKNKVKNGLQEAEEGEEPMDEDPMGGEEPMDDAPMGGEDEPMGDDEPMGGEDTPMGDDEPMDDDFNLDDDMGDNLDDVDLEGDDMEDNDAELEMSDNSSEIESLRSEINSLKDLVASVAEKLGVSSESIASAEFNDDPLYDDSEIDDENDLEDDSDFDFEIGTEGDDFEGDDLGFEDDTEIDGEDTEFEDDDDDDTEVFESRSYKRMKALNEDKLNYFGGHPAYRKQPVQLPQTGEDNFNGNSDWNDESVYSEDPYGEKIGSGAPFEVDPATIENAIAESIKRILGGKKRV